MDTAWISRVLRAVERHHDRGAWGKVIEAVALPALIAGHRHGLSTYRPLGRDAELVTLDAMPAAIRTGTALIEALVARRRAEGCERLWLTMTNDNLSELRFYLRRGFRLIQVRPGAVDAARKLHGWRSGTMSHDNQEL
jgi:GNAT superfamily N-acetyltransferase